MGTMESPWYASTMNARELTREYARRKCEMVHEAESRCDATEW